MPNTWSPLREKYGQGNVSVSLAEILSYTVSLSDNNCCDILFRLVGGPSKGPVYSRLRYQRRKHCCHRRRNASGSHKIKGLLPEGTPVVHKTGYSGPDSAGVTAASNDIGIIALPNGQHLAIAFFVSMTKEEERVIDHIIAECSKAAYDYFLK